MRFLLLCALLESTVAEKVYEGFHCKYGEDRSACLQNKDGHQCCTNVAGRPDSFYCKSGTTGIPGGSGTNDCGKEIFWVPTGVSIKCCKPKPKEDEGSAGSMGIIIGAAVGGVVVVVAIVAIVIMVNKNNQAAAATTPGQGSPPPPIQQAVPMEHAIAMPGMPLGTALNVMAQPQAAVMAPVTPPVTPPQPPEGPNTGNRFDPITGQPVPKFDPLTGIQNWFDAPKGPSTGSRFDPNTGQPIPKFDPLTGVQNWFDA